MSALTLSIVVLFGAALLVVPRRWMPLPLLMGACYLPYYSSVEVGPFHFTAIRLLLAVACLSVFIRGGFSLRPLTPVDYAMLAWSAWLVASSAFHDEPGTLVFRLGLAYDAAGIYLLFRTMWRSAEDLGHVYQLFAVLLVPLAVEMALEVLTVHNWFSALGGVGESPMIRNGRVRANGPFGHPVLAGTVGGVCLPFMAALYHTHRKTAIVGAVACVSILLASASSGPIMTAAAGAIALMVWRYRARVRRLQVLALSVYVLLDIVMKDPAYFLIARIDLAGGSTSWYRARLIESAFEHLSEWWLVGTDYTKHWMAVVVPWSPNHTDITSHYIQLGVYGGLPLLLMFGCVLLSAFAGVGRGTATASPLSPETRFLLWAAGCSLFAHALTMLSVSYFDQSFVFLYLPVAAISAVCSSLGAVDPVPVGRVVRPATAVRVNRSATHAGSPAWRRVSRDLAHDQVQQTDGRSNSSRAIRSAWHKPDASVGHRRFEARRGGK